MTAGAPLARACCPPGAHALRESSYSSRWLDSSTERVSASCGYCGATVERTTTYSGGAAACVDEAAWHGDTQGHAPARVWSREVAP